MLTEKQISQIELGPRQLLLFDFEDTVSAELDQTLTCLTAYIETYATAVLDDFLPEAAARTHNSEFNILQHLFWLTNDLRLSFRESGRNISPAKAKEFLVQSPDSQVEIALNKPVDEVIVKSTKESFKRIDGDQSGLERMDQIAFARCLARQIKQWERALQAWRPLAQQPGFPGPMDLDAGLAAVKSICKTFDPFSLINAFHQKAEFIADLADQIRTLGRFYQDHGGNWPLLVKLAADFKNTIGLDPQDETIAAAWERFNSIVLSARPYADVKEAWQLMRVLKPRHDQIALRQLQKYGTARKMKIENLIQRMKKHLQTHGASENLCHESLYALRKTINGIDAAKSTAMIDRQVQAAAEAFETTWEMVIEQAGPGGPSNQGRTL